MIRNDNRIILLFFFIVISFLFFNNCCYASDYGDFNASIKIIDYEYDSVNRLLTYRFIADSELLPFSVIYRTEETEYDHPIYNTSLNKNIYEFTKGFIYSEYYYIRYMNSDGDIAVFRFNTSPENLGFELMYGSGYVSEISRSLDNDNNGYAEIIQYIVLGKNAIPREYNRFSDVEIGVSNNYIFPQTYTLSYAGVENETYILYTPDLVSYLPIENSTYKIYGYYYKLGENKPDPPYPNPSDDYNYDHDYPSGDPFDVDDNNNIIEDPAPDPNLDPIPFTVCIYKHETGSVEFYFKNFNFPMWVQRSEMLGDYETIGRTNENSFWDYGLENGKTYYYKFIDNTGYSLILRYTPPFLTKLIYPLQVVQINDTSVHLRFDEPYGIKTLYLNNEYYCELKGTEFTIDDLEAGSTYEVYLISEVGKHKSNTITFTTTKNFDLLESLLKKILMPDMTDSNSNGIPDIIEEINIKLDTIVDKIGGRTINDVRDNIDNIISSEWTDGDLPVISADYMGLEIRVLDLNNDFFIDVISDIRNLILAILTISFIFGVLNLFNINFKV